jgi:CheY-like chemotaxis protein
VTEYLTRLVRDRAGRRAVEDAWDAPAAEEARRVVLLVDDDPETRATHTRALAEELGQAVVVARDGAEAISRARQHRPAVVVLDVGRPGLDGCTLAATLRADAATAGAWLIALTATGSPREAARAGFDQFLWKPVDVEHLALAVQAGLVRTTALRSPTR